MYLTITVGLPPEDDDIEVHGTYMTDGEYRTGRFHPGDVQTASEVTQSALADERMAWIKRMEDIVEMLEYVAAHNDNHVHHLESVIRKAERWIEKEKAGQ